MNRLVRYALATFCLAASVGCLGLWGWSTRFPNKRVVVRCAHKLNDPFEIEYDLLSATNGRAMLSIPRGTIVGQYPKVFVAGMSTAAIERSNRDGIAGSYFSVSRLQLLTEFRFPLWYPALVFALAGVGVLRFRRQFSIRSAMIVTAVVAALIGLAVIL